MRPIKNIVFDLGGVIIDLDRDQAVARFEAIGVSDADELIDAYEQKGIFLEIENGKIDAQTFCDKLCKHTGKTLDYATIQQAWLGFVTAVPQYKLDFILELRKSYRIYLLSNTNPIMQDWARSERFTEAGKPISAYFDQMFTSYESGFTKPDLGIFNQLIKETNLDPGETLFVDDGTSNITVGKQLGFQVYQPENGEDWREPIQQILNESKADSE